MSDALHHHLKNCTACEDNFLKGWGTVKDDKKRLDEARHILSVQAILEENLRCHLDGRCEQVLNLKDRHVNVIEAKFGTVVVPCTAEGLDDSKPSGQSAKNLKKWRQVCIDAADKAAEIKHDYAYQYIRGGSIYGRNRSILLKYHNDKHKNICTPMYNTIDKTINVIHAERNTIPSTVKDRWNHDSTYVITDADSMEDKDRKVMAFMRDWTKNGRKAFPPFMGHSRAIPFDTEAKGLVHTVFGIPGVAALVIKQGHTIEFDENRKGDKYYPVHNKTFNASKKLIDFFKGRDPATGKDATHHFFVGVGVAGDAKEIGEVIKEDNLKMPCVELRQLLQHLIGNIALPWQNVGALVQLCLGYKLPKKRMNANNKDISLSVTNAWYLPLPTLIEHYDPVLLYSEKDNSTVFYSLMNAYLYKILLVNGIARFNDGIIKRIVRGVEDMCIWAGSMYRTESVKSGLKPHTTVEDVTTILMRDQFPPGFIDREHEEEDGDTAKARTVADHVKAAAVRLLTFGTPDPPLKTARTAAEQHHKLVQFASDPTYKKMQASMRLLDSTSDEGEPAEADMVNEETSNLLDDEPPERIVNMDKYRVLSNLVDGEEMEVEIAETHTTTTENFNEYLDLTCQQQVDEFEAEAAATKSNNNNKNSNRSNNNSSKRDPLSSFHQNGFRCQGSSMHNCKNVLTDEQFEEAKQHFRKCVPLAQKYMNELAHLHLPGSLKSRLTAEQLTKDKAREKIILELKLRCYSPSLKERYNAMSACRILAKFYWGEVTAKYRMLGPALHMKSAVLHLIGAAYNPVPWISPADYRELCEELTVHFSPGTFNISSNSNRFKKGFKGAAREKKMKYMQKHLMNNSFFKANCDRDVWNRLDAEYDKFIASGTLIKTMETKVHYTVLETYAAMHATTHGSNREANEWRGHDVPKFTNALRIAIHTGIISPCCTEQTACEECEVCVELCVKYDVPDQTRVVCVNKQYDTLKFTHVQDLFSNNQDARVRDFVRPSRNKGLHTSFKEAVLANTERPDLNRYKIEFLDTDLANVKVAASTAIVSGPALPRVEKSGDRDRSHNRNSDRGKKDETYQRIIRHVANDLPITGEKRKRDAADSHEYHDSTRRRDSPGRSRQGDDRYHYDDRCDDRSRDCNRRRDDHGSRGRRHDSRSRDRHDDKYYRGSRRNDYHRDYKDDKPDLRENINRKRAARRSPSPPRRSFSTRTKEEEKYYSMADKRHSRSMPSRR